MHFRYNEQARTITADPETRTKADGTRGTSMGFCVCEIDQYLTAPHEVAAVIIEALHAKYGSE